MTILYNKDINGVAYVEDYYCLDMLNDYSVFINIERKSIMILDRTPYRNYALKADEVFEFASKCKDTNKNKNKYKLSIEDSIRYITDKYLKMFYHDTKSVVPYSGLESGFCDYFYFIKILKSYIDKEYNEDYGMKYMSGIFVFKKKNKLNPYMYFEKDSKRPLESMTVYFDGTNFYSPYHNMNKISAMKFIEMLVELNGDIMLSSKSVLPLRYTNALSSTMWLYLTGELTGDIDKVMMSVIGDKIKECNELISNQEFRKYIYRRNLTIKEVMNR